MIFFSEHIQGASLVTQLTKNSPTMRETLVRFLGQEDPLEKDRLLTLIFLGITGGSDSKESTCNAGDPVRSLGWEEPQEEGMATHSSILCLGNPHGQRYLGDWSPWYC